MILSIIILLVSLFLDGLISVIFTNISSNFLVLALILIYPFFTSKKHVYIILLLIGTISYDLLYTNILFLNTTTCFCLFLLIDKNFKKLEILDILRYYLTYHIILFSLLYIVNYVENIFLLFKVIIYNSILSIVYVFIVYYLLKNKYPTKYIN